MQAGNGEIYIITLVTLIYLLILAFLGFRGYKNTKTAADYLVAGRKTHPMIMALSYGATFISTSAIIGFGGAAGLFGMGLLWLTFLNIFVGIFIAFVFFGKRTRRIGHNLQAHTFPELLGKRFQSKFVQMYAGIVIFVFMPLYAAAVLIGAARFIEEALGVNYNMAVAFFSIIVAAYVVAGGLKGVMYTDAFQGVLMFIGMAILLVATYVHLGGITEAHAALASLSDKVPAGLQKGGITNWASMPNLGSPLWMTLVTTIILGVGIGVLAQPQLVVRFMTVKSNRELNRAVVVGGIFILMMTGVAFIVGSLANVYFVRSPQFGKVAVAAAGGNIDKIMPLYINSFMPTWFVAVFMLTLLSAAMSTLSSQFHAMGTAIGRDVYEQAVPGRPGEMRTVLITRIGIILAILVTVWLGFKLPGGIIAAATALFFGLCAAAFLPMFIGGLYTRRMTRPAAVASLIVGTVVALFWLAFMQGKTAGQLGLCKALFGPDKAALTSPTSRWFYLDAQMVALPLSLITAVVVTYLTKPLPEGHLAACFAGFRKKEVAIPAATTAAPPSTGA